MILNKNQSGFTFIEILVALGIMTFGFLAMSQMQYLSLRQKNLAELGTVGSNIIQSAIDRDLKRTRKVHFLNQVIFEKEKRGIDTSVSTFDDFCDGTAPTSCPQTTCEDPCTACPCNPLDSFTSDSTTNNFVETLCNPIDDLENFSPEDIDFVDEATCNGIDTPFYLLRRVNTNFDNTVNPIETTLNVGYAVKTPNQLTNYTWDDPLITSNSVLVQNILITAYINDWSDTVNRAAEDWTNIMIPNLP